MATAENARRTIPKRTYAPLQVEKHTMDGVSDATAKLAFVRNLDLQSGEVDAVVRPSEEPPDRRYVEMLRNFEGRPLAALTPRASDLASVPNEALLAFGKALVESREAALDTAPPPAGDMKVLDDRADTGFSKARAADLLNAAVVATNVFANQVTATPVGLLHLEKVEMTPAGVERGELIATIPLAPKEQTEVVQKEWSDTTKEFTSIVTDSFEDYSEKGVTENNELAKSTTNQIQHSNQFNINSTVSGGCGFVTATVSASFGMQDAINKTISDSEKHARQTTQSASSRVKQEHKTTISTRTETGESQTTTRQLENPSDANAIRIDYFSLMRKWRVRLYRYGLRMTYDIAIPEPGATLRELFAQIDDLEGELNTPFKFKLSPNEITRDNYATKAADFHASVPEPPAAEITSRYGGAVPGLGKLGEDEGWHFFEVPFTVPQGYEVTHVTLDAMIGNVDNQDNDGDYLARHFTLFGYGVPAGLDQNGKASFVVDLTLETDFMTHATGTQKIVYFLQNVDAAGVTFILTFKPTPDAMAQWQLSVWQVLHDAERDAFYARQQTLTQERDELRAKLEVNTLTLRREENDEIMKGVLRWLLGSGFEFMPPDVEKVFATAGGDLVHGVSFTGNDAGISSTMWTTMYQYEEMVKFVNEAIEWENVLYFLYSYFWDVPLSWDFIRQIEHPDATRQAFLRAGSARVVLPVRKGYEEAWLAFVERGDFGRTLPPDHPYMTLAQEIQAFDETNYPGIPPANPGAPPVEPVDVAAAVSNDKLSASGGPVTIAVDSSEGFQVGAQVTVDSLSSGVQELRVITTIPDKSHLQVASLSYAHDGSTEPFPLVQAGESGVVVAEWYEYTPTSGVDIAVTSNLATVA